jgi:8-oxo-dGTP pyrophosphatase MutT (NUDIX family)
MNQIRPVAICVFRKVDRILVAEGYDPVKDEHFYRPLGGGIEFGENSKDTIRRELMEEVQLEADDDSLRYLGAVENVFMFNGAAGHDIVLVYDGILKDASMYAQECIHGREANGEPIRAVWKSLDEFGEGKAILYPTGLLKLLQ